ncbi:MAG: flagellar biosynthesis protein FlhF [Planctomycetaceae bacterium]
MQEALDLVRTEVGPDAMILHTKQVSERGLLPWKKSAPEVEITVALEEVPSKSRLSESVADKYRGEYSPAEEEAPQPSKSKRPARRPPQNSQSMAMQLLSQIGQEADELDLSSSVKTPRRPAPQTTPSASTSAESPIRESILTRPLTASQRKSYLNGEEEVAAVRTVLQNSRPEAKTQNRPRSIAADSIAKSSERGESSTRPVKQQPQPATPPANQSRSSNTSRVTESLASGVTQNQASAPKSYVDQDFANRLANIERMLMNLGRQNPMLAMHELPNSLFNLYTKLLDVDVAEDVARELVFDFKKQCRTQELEIEGRTDALLEGMLEKEFRCSGPIQVPQGRRKVVALVGATGVGKTTTIAKLAANFKLRQGLKVGLVTVDTYRIAAVEQLRTYAEIMDLPIKVVTNPQEMRQALDELQGLDLVLIDTGGRSPKDELKIEELKQLLQEARADEVHLVLNLTASQRSLESMAAEFKVAGTTSMILTKLDETEGLGPLLNLARKVSLPVSYLTTGQAVPEDIEPASVARMRKLLLGQEYVGQLV